ncbi:hypothetical protein [Methylobacterium sp. Leaf118]|uniref:hypothetical protein n=1 Tax=Methylobacterium sp. Leaf118 TaxID=2876562 RepID=UPI001E655A0B|nr:hypothetical protein [Methylobacterium sp. Leaf118]
MPEIVMMTKRIGKLASLAAAALLAGPLLGAPAQAEQTAQTGSGTTSPPQTAKGACRVKDYVGGRTCTGDVPESVCAAIAREAKGQYTWTQEECP